MIVLDTNLISELMRSQPHPGVVAWAAVQPRATLFTTSISRAEILFGITALPEGRRRAALTDSAAAMFDEDLAGRVLPFGSAAASRYAEIAVLPARLSKPSMR